MGGGGAENRVPMRATGGGGQVGEIGQMGDKRRWGDGGDG